MTDIVPPIYFKIFKKDGYRQVSRSLIYARSLVVEIHNKLNPSNINTLLIVKLHNFWCYNTQPVDRTSQKSVNLWTIVRVYDPHSLFWVSNVLMIYSTFQEWQNLHLAKILEQTEVHSQDSKVAQRKQHLRISILRWSTYDQTTTKSIMRSS